MGVGVLHERLSINHLIYGQPLERGLLRFSPHFSVQKFERFYGQGVCG
jgi:hypothetical protein